jgi:acetyltransferase-like isoleucine patch superfamily enzyme
MRKWLKQFTVLRMLRVFFRFGLSDVANALIVSAIRNIDGPIGEALRYEYYRKRLKSIGRNVRIDTHVFITGAEYISIGDDVHLDKGVILVASAPDLDLSGRDMEAIDIPQPGVSLGELKIGNCIHVGVDCLISAYGGVRIDDRAVLSAGCKLYSLTNLPHSPFNPHERIGIMPYSGRSPSLIGPIIIEENVWLGLNCCVFPGVVLGKDTFARTNSVVLTSAPENSFVRGDPAIPTRHRYTEQVMPTRQRYTEPV